MEMTGYLPEYIIDELGKARNKKLEKNISMKVRFNDKFYPIIKFSDNSFSIKAMEDIRLRGLVDIYSNNSHSYQALIVAQQVNGDVIDFSFKRNTVIKSGPALDFEKNESLISGLLSKY
jgi:hypothetical protein